jgi:ribosomal protein S6--L-glutamate ligase
VVIGDRVVASYWRLQSADGFHNNIAAGGRLDFSPAPPAAIELVERVSRGLGIDHAGFDVAMVGDRPYILEFNRLFGNHGLSEQDIKPAELIYRYLLQRSGNAQ